MKLTELETKKIDESSLSRVWQHANSERPFALFTAFRDEVANDEVSKRKINQQRNVAAAAEIRKAGFGFFYVDGHWIENEGTPDEVEVAEDSIFAISDVNKEQEFVNLIVSLGKQYNQDAVLIKTSKGVHLYNQAGKPFAELGELSPGKAGDMYSKLRGNKGTFVFEAERDGKGFMGKMAERALARKK